MLKFLDCYEDDLAGLSDRDLLDAYLSSQGVMGLTDRLLAAQEAIRESNVGILCYHTVPISDSLLATLNSLPPNATFVTITEGRVVYTCR